MTHGLLRALVWETSPGPTYKSVLLQRASGCLCQVGWGRAISRAPLPGRGLSSEVVKRPLPYLLPAGAKCGAGFVDGAVKPMSSFPVESWEGAFGLAVRA